jgi:ADP-ribosyl-[dinitrogen reductase] hydrolase
MNVLIGTAIGDALGVFAESKPSDYEPLLNWDGSSYLGSDYHGLKPGQYSDDTQFSRALAQSLTECGGFDPVDVSKKYVELFTSNTIRGYGRTTKTAIDNLIAGKSYSESGVPESYGNGTFMRAQPIGLVFRKDLKSLIEVSTIDAKITHNSDEAVAGSLAIALLAAFIANKDENDFLKIIPELLPSSEVKNSFIHVSSLVNNPLISTSEALKLLGTHCDVRQSVPAVFYCYAKFDNYKDGARAIIRAGHDTDTHAAALCGLYGIKYGINHFDTYHLSNLEDIDDIWKLDRLLAKV